MTAKDVASAVRGVLRTPSFAAARHALVYIDSEDGWQMIGPHDECLWIDPQWAVAILLCELRKLPPSPERDEAIKKLEALK